MPASALRIVFSDVAAVSILGLAAARAVEERIKREIFLMYIFAMMFLNLCQLE